jgi:ADP-ribosylglycohydrolase
MLGGAVGDALGNALEFLSLDEIRAAYGKPAALELVLNVDGIAEITDDTQMTLFTTDGFRRARVRAQLRGIRGAMGEIVRDAYLCWLDTQELAEPPPDAGYRHRTGWLRHEQWLYVRRAPGSACLSGLRVGHSPDPYGAVDGRPGPVNRDSKGCGTVIRSAPFGFPLHGRAEDAFVVSANCAQITHGHPTGYYAAGAFAAMIAYLVGGDSLEGAVLRTMRLLAGYPGHDETLEALRRAVDLAGTGKATAEKVESLGAGWTAEEALAIAVYAALAPVDLSNAWPETEVEARLRLAVYHSGDSDSTGAICGNLLGARFGESSLPWRWVSRIEGRATIAQLADDFATELDQARGY